MGLWDINNAYFKYCIWGSGIATNFTKIEVRGTLRVNEVPATTVFAYSHI